MMRLTTGIRAVQRWFRFFQRPANRPRRRSGTLAFPVAAQVLEARCLLSSTTVTAAPAAAAAGPGWADGTALTLSFAPDGTQAGGQTSSLFATLGNLGDAATWERTILHAFQTWAASANINIGVVSDSGQSFGTPGSTQADARFGDIRIGAAPLSSNVMAIAMSASGSVSGTWSGDIIFNSNVQFGSLNDLYAVALHEAGHVLGLPETTNPNSPMYSGFTPGTVLPPTAADIAALQSLYGPRISNPGHNGTLATASRIAYPSADKIVPSTDEEESSTVKKDSISSTAYDGSTPLVNYGQIGLPSEASYFSIEPPSAYKGSITFELRTAGLSGLQGRISVYNARGNLVAQSSPGVGPGQDVSVQINATGSSSRFYIKVDSGTNDMHGIGSFALVTKFDRLNTVSKTAIDALARGQFASLGASQIRQYFLTGNLPGAGAGSQPESSSTGTGSSPIELSPTRGYAEGTHYSVAGVLTSGNPVVTYRVEPAQLASGQPDVMTVSIQADRNGGIAPAVSVLDDGGNVLAGELLSNGPGLYTLQVNGIAPGKEYFVRIGAANTPAVNSKAGYRLELSFSLTGTSANQYVAGVLGPTQSQQFFQLNVAQSTLFQLALDTSSSTTQQNVAVQMAIFDQSGNQVYQLTGTAGGMLSASAVMLHQGNYVVRVAAASSSGTLSGNFGFTVLGNVLSDPVGPIPVDPTGAPPISDVPIPPPFYWNDVVIPTPGPDILPPFYWTNVFPLMAPVVVLPNTYPTPATP